MEYRYCVCSGLDSFIKNGFDTKGNQRYKCKYCNSTQSINKKLKLLTTNLFYRKIFSNEELYCLGLLYADGWVNNNRLGICLATKDIELIYIIKKVFKLDTSISNITRKNGRKHSQIVFRIAYFQDDLLHLGFMPNKTGKELWLNYMKSPDFVRGFMDGDGSVFIQRNALRISFVCQNKSFLEGLTNYIYELTYIKPKTIYEKGKANVYMTRYCGRQAIVLGDYLYKDSEGLRLERKYNKYLEIKKSPM